MKKSFLRFLTEFLSIDVKQMPGRNRKHIALAISACLIIAAYSVCLAKPKQRVVKDVPTRAGHKRHEAKPDPVTEFSLNQKLTQANGIQLRQHLQGIVTKPGVRAFLATIKRAEGGAPNLMVGGCRARTLQGHPATTLPKRCRFPVRLNGHRTFSTASGDYQLTLTNWNKIAPFLGLHTFSENNQALAALELIRRGGGAASARIGRGLSLKNRIQQGFIELLKGNVKKALCLATYDWASSRCSPLPASHKVDYTRILGSVTRGRFQF